ncbi:MAG: ATP-binding protein [Clostridium sp.]
MYWKSKWEKLSIKKKIFLLTGGLVITAFTVFYVLMYNLMPKVYNTYKSYILNNNLNTLINSFEKNENIDAQDELYRFAFENNALFIVKDSKGQVMYLSRELGKPVMMKPPREEGGRINETKSFYFKKINEECTIELMANFKPIDEATKAILLFSPFMIVITLVLAFILAKIYTKFFSKPVLDINESAKKISKLDFSNKLVVSGEDEISELCKNINYMSECLEKNIKGLEEANRKLKSDIEKEREIERQRREFIATISHELKSPLTIIGGQIEGMMLNIGKFKDRDSYLKECHLVIESMKILVNEILSLSKLEEDNFKLTLSELSLTELMEECVCENQFFALDKELKVNMELRDDVWIIGDRALLKRAFNNIIGNAFKYTPNGNVVNIVLTDSSIFIENNGTSISEEDLNNIFKAFYRVDKSRNRKTGGSGLGLYIVKSILDRHEGMKYEMTSNDNKVTFSLYFKLVEETDGDI